MYFLLTNDVECYSFRTNTYDPKVAEELYITGVPRLLDLYNKHDIECTFYVTGKVAELKPEILDLIKEKGHEIGCHGYEHTNEKALDTLSYEKQLEEIRDGKRLVEKTAGKISSFRAPALRINNHTIRVLEELGFKTDSSVASQRFDGPLSFGSMNKLGWLTATRQPYRPSRDNPFRAGNSELLEVPVSALILPYIGTTMRISKTVTRILGALLTYESMLSEKPITFIIHPNETIDVTGVVETQKRGGNLIEKVFADKLRHKLKVKNLGLKTVNLLDELISSAKKKGFEFTTVEQYSKALL